MRGFFLCYFMTASSLLIASSGGCLNVELLIYGLWPPAMLQAIPLVGPGFDIGIDEANRELSNILRIERTYISGLEVVGCEDTGAYFDQISRHYYGYTEQKNDSLLILVYLGCDDSTIFGQLAREWNILAISGGTSNPDQRDRVLYPTTLLSGPFQFELYSTMFEKVCEAFNWSRVGLAYDTSGAIPFPTEIYKAFAASGSVRSGKLQLQPFPIPPEANLTTILQKISQAARVVFISGTPALIRKFMIRTLEQNMTSHNEYVWITVDLPEVSIGPVTWYRNDSDDEVALKAFGSLMQMIICFDHDPEANRLLKGQIRRKTGEMYGYRYAPDREPSEFATSSYLIAKMLASVVNDSIQQGLDINNGRLLAHQFLNTTYTAEPIGRLFIDSFGERQSKICLSPFNHSHGGFTRALYCDHTETTLQRVPNTVIVWNTPGNQPPRDTPLCGFLGEGESCRKISITPVIIVMAILILIFTSFLCYLRHRFSHHGLHHDSWWRLETPEIKHKPA
ncbi:hypothetical protein BV898_15136 [Hypsibius exemplaris]|uniref:Receptor ligand binding region domain-containing protein n=1 Tax=Hypsibius exemplaris TaxID=2072580 RepID=A0A9X6NDC0_HYPEX|nr:hypothetical protein BV898_15136 [Hypsibius exemplaris]